MAVTGNLTTLSITEADVTARMPTVHLWRSRSSDDWDAQLAAGQEDALDAFREAKTQDPARAVPVSASAWTRVLVYSTLVVIFKGVPGDEAIPIKDRWEGEFQKALKNMLYRYDVDDSGEITDTVDEERQQRIGEAVIVR
jgi:hypothetical protein